MKKYYVLILLTVYQIDSQVLANEPRSLHVGEQIEISVLDGLEVELSRKGIVDISFTGEKSAKITGLRSGFVLIKLYSGNRVTKAIPIHVIRNGARESRFNKKIESSKVDQVSYVLFAKIELLESSDYDLKKGFDSLDLKFVANSFSTSGFSAASKNSANTGVILCSPSVKSFTGEPFLIRGGSKVALSSSGGGSPSVIDWIESGLTIEGRLSKLAESRFLLEFSAEILSKTSEENEFGRYKMESTLPVNLNEFIKVGEIDITQDSKGNGYLSFFSDVPIIGPFFRSSQKLNAKSKMALSIKVEVI